MQQRTLRNSVKVSGTGLHTGAYVELALHPADVDHGIVFKVKQGDGWASIPALDIYVEDLVRGTTLAKDGVKVHTVEHLLSALYGLGIDNVLVEMWGNEVPILDGSSKPWVEAIGAVGFENQSAEKTFFELTEPVSVVDGDRSIMIVPSDEFRITCTSTDDRKTHTQHLSMQIDAENYAKGIADARTFTLYEDIEPLIKQGKIKGGNLDCAVVIQGDKILSNEPLRYEDEFVRHKILDLIGDLALLGKPIKGHVIAIKPGHALNAKLVRSMIESAALEDIQLPTNEANAVLDIGGILKRLPHRYPFVMVDRVLSVEENGLVAIKNVTINEPCFTGHFPENPVFPGVLQIEAMAQAAGLMMSLKLGHTEVHSKVYFMSVDKVKFRSIVQPGDQLRIEVKLLKMKNNRVGYAEGKCFVKEKVASSAELMFMIANN